MRHRSRSAFAVTAPLVLLLLAGCSSSSKSAAPPAAASSNHPASSDNPASPAASGAPAVSGSVTVLAASSLQAAFTTLASQFEAVNPGVKIKLSFGASSALAEQINSGAPADVFAPAAVMNMQQVIAKGGALTSTNFVKNVMEIAVPPSNPAKITAVADLARTGVKVALCQTQVPCGATAAKVFANAKVTVKPVTLEADVKSTLAKVELDEVDAGVVYVTDVLAAKAKVKGIMIPANVNASTEYPIATLAKARNPTGAQAFVAYVLSAAGQTVLAADGFAKP